MRTRVCNCLGAHASPVCPGAMQVVALPAQLPFVTLRGQSCATRAVARLSTATVLAAVCDIACRSCMHEGVTGCSSCAPGLYINGDPGAAVGAVGPCVPSVASASSGPVAGDATSGSQGAAGPPPPRVC